jgi:hypothetical protein
MTEAQTEPTRAEIADIREFAAATGAMIVCLESAQQAMGEAIDLLVRENTELKTQILRLGARLEPFEARARTLKSALGLLADMYKGFTK